MLSSNETTLASLLYKFPVDLVLDEETPSVIAR